MSFLKMSEMSEMSEQSEANELKELNELNENEWVFCEMSEQESDVARWGRI